MRHFFVSGISIFVLVAVSATSSFATDLRYRLVKNATGHAVIECDVGNGKWVGYGSTAGYDPEDFSRFHPAGQYAKSIGTGALDAMGMLLPAAAGAFAGPGASFNNGTTSLSGMITGLTVGGGLTGLTWLAKSMNPIFHWKKAGAENTILGAVKNLKNGKEASFTMDSESMKDLVSNLPDSNFFELPIRATSNLNNVNKGSNAVESIRDSLFHLAGIGS